MISIVTSLYQSESYLEEFYRRIKSALDQINKDYEIIFVNDGSPDKSLKACLDLKAKDSKIKIVDLARNFGHQSGLLAGIDVSCGDYVFLIDCDLEEPPELIEQFYNQLQSDSNIDVVYGVQKKRSGNILRQFNGWLFYWIFNYLCDFKYVKNVMTVRLMSRRYVESLKQFTENQMELFGIFVLTGFNQRGVLIDKPYKGKTTYSVSKKISIALESLTAFSKRPLELVFYSGIIIFFVSFIAGVYIIYLKIIYGASVEGWVSITLSIWLLGGLTIFFMGIIGLYLSKLFLEIKGRPKYIVKKIYE